MISCCFGSTMEEGSGLSVILELGSFSYIMAESREYKRSAREDKVEDLAAAENDDQYHQSFLRFDECTPGLSSVQLCL
ncbi:hypothetical protein Lalb_Chr02g0160061 [Lupinus albus]|uniref:Uncharacterized protein n=1 Tax=Lupinus albus TaxID=3870 RepID=A0A6A4R290_LUPAL|nr:hypothetical protein Lalb_Chr02g0160061 [Lupinus albus]